MAAKVLLVEDDQEQAMLFAQVLQMSGYAVDVVSDAAEAQARLTAEPYDLLLTDLDLVGGMNGDALIRWAKMHDASIKSILFSNHPLVDDVAAACGADAAFHKIEGIVQLRKLVKSVMTAGSDHA